MRIIKFHQFMLMVIFFLSMGFASGYLMFRELPAKPIPADLCSRATQYDLPSEKGHYVWLRKNFNGWTIHGAGLDEKNYSSAAEAYEVFLTSRKP